MGNLCNKTVDVKETKVNQNVSKNDKKIKEDLELIKKKEEEINKKNLDLYAIQAMIKKENEEILPLNNDLQIFVKNFSEFEENMIISVNNKQMDPTNSEYDEEIQKEKTKSEDLFELLKLKQEHLLEIEGRIKEIENRLKIHETDKKTGTDSLISRTLASFDVLENEFSNSKNMLHSIDKSKKNIDRIYEEIKSYSITKITRFE